MFGRTAVGLSFAVFSTSRAVGNRAAVTSICVLNSSSPRRYVAGADIADSKEAGNKKKNNKKTMHFLQLHDTCRREALQSRLDNFLHAKDASVDSCAANQLLRDLANAGETSALIRLWDLTAEREEATWHAISELHDLGKGRIPEGILRLPQMARRTLSPPRRLHKIMKGRIIKERSDLANVHLDAAIALLKKAKASGQEFSASSNGRKKLQKFLMRELGVNKQTARGLVTKLKAKKIVQKPKDQFEMQTRRAVVWWEQAKVSGNTVPVKRTDLAEKLSQELQVRTKEAHKLLDWLERKQLLKPAESQGDAEVVALGKRLDWSAFRVDELKEVLRSRGLSTLGLKAELTARLAADSND